MRLMDEEFLIDYMIQEAQHLQQPLTSTFTGKCNNCNYEFTCKHGTSFTELADYRIHYDKCTKCKDNNASKD